MTPFHLLIDVHIEDSLCEMPRYNVDLIQIIVNVVNPIVSAATRYFTSLWNS